ncbi:MAG: transglycosylase domain-containing protein [Mogibacterium sp.]|nr:transglycosylase domain-containing protein [Mogibacterium sp.]
MARADRNKKRVTRKKKGKSNMDFKKILSKLKLTGTPKQKILKVIGGLFVIGFLYVFLTVGITAIRIGAINSDSLYKNIDQSSTLYDINGNEIDTLHYTEDRTVVSIDEMPDDLKNAFIAIEDKTFYKHHGFNFKRMAGAVLNSLTGGSRISGTSTITQQLARNAYLAEIKSQRSISRKLSEMYIAWRLEHSLTKDQILEAYLNTIYLGYGNYGVNAAARTYFSKEVNELTLAESAALAALPQAPDAYALITTDAGEDNEPITEVSYYTLNDLAEAEEIEEEDTEAETSYSYNNNENDNDDDAEEGESESTGYFANDLSKDRRNTVLSLMADQGYISDSEADAANVDIIDILKPSFEKTESPYTYFSDYISDVVTKDLIDQYGISEEEAQRMVYTGGLNIYTTLNSEMQEIIYKEFQDDSNFPTAVDDSEVQASMVVTEVDTGYISALVGGRDASGSKLFNRAISPRQPGSSIKPLSVYGAALQKSYELAKQNKTFNYIDYGIDNQGTDYWGDYITASSTVIDEPLTIDGEEWPQNVTRTFSGSNTFRTALQQSINTCAVKILLQVQPDYSVDLLKKFGLTTIVDDESEEVNDVNPAALGLGAMTYGVTPLEMSLAYAAFPNGGKINEAVCYTRVADRFDKTLLTGKIKSTKVLDEGVAWIMTDLLKSVVSDGIAGNARISGMEVGGKTGTTNDLFDVWFDGFTPDYSGALWIGTDLNVEMNGGSYQAARLWGKIMGQVTGIKDGEYLEMPSNVVEKGGEYYTEGTEENLSTYGGHKKSKDDDEEEIEEPELEVIPDATIQTPEATDTTGGGTSGGTDSGNSGGSEQGGSGDSGGTSGGGTDTGGGTSGGGTSGGGTDTGGGTSGGGSEGGGTSGGGSEGGGTSGGGSEGGGSGGGTETGGGESGATPGGAEG